MEREKIEAEEKREKMRGEKGERENGSERLRAARKADDVTAGLPSTSNFATLKGYISKFLLCFDKWNIS